MKRALSIVAGLVLAAAAPAAAHASHTATVRPKVLGLTTSVRHLTADGGAVALRARVRSARTCVFTETRGGTVVATRTSACTAGRASVTLRSAPNRTATPLTLHFAVRATSAAGSDHASVDVVQDGVAPLQVVAAGPLSSGIVGNAYATTLLAEGGVEPYTWSLVSGSLPAGLVLGADGSLTGTPTATTQASFTAQVSDATGAQATGAFTLEVTSPTTSVETSLNWAGYIDRGGPFTAVAGTFNVPSIAAGSSGTDVAEWIGVDGDSNTDLIQAGVAQTTQPFTGRQQVYAWWEILPDPETRISMPVAAGDRVTVSIAQTQPGTWTIRIADATNGHDFQTTLAYGGEASSAEWIVEAPTTGRGTQTSLATFTPSVTFTNLAATGAVSEVAAVQMVQRSVAVATASPLGATGFTVAYGSAVPETP